MKAAVDIGTNSTRLLVVSPQGEVGRWQTVTGLGRGLGERGLLTESSMARTLAALNRYGEVMAEHEVTHRRAVATSAVRDASNRVEFLDRAERALGVRPENISGEEEARLSFAGAVSELADPQGCMVVDIGGGSTEFVWREQGIPAEGMSEKGVRGVSLQLGSVRLTETVLPDRPPTAEQMPRAFRRTADLLSTVSLPFRPKVVGVAGTWTSLAAIGLRLRSYDRDRVHHAVMPAAQLAIMVSELAGMTVEETAAIPSLEPARAPMILAGAVIAHEALRRLAAPEVLISESDLLDGVIASL